MLNNYIFDYPLSFSTYPNHPSGGTNPLSLKIILQVSNLNMRLLSAALLSCLVSSAASAQKSESRVGGIK